MKIRKLFLDDLKEVLKIEKSSFPAPWSESYFKKILKKYPNDFLAAELSGKIIGYILGCADIEEKNSVFIKKLAVHPGFRQKRIGTKLLNFAVNKLKKAGAKKLFARARTNNKGACAFYQKNSFKIKDTIEKYYKNGDDAYLMEK